MKKIFSLYLSFLQILSKYLVVKNFPWGEFKLATYFRCCLIFNTGIAFSLFDDGGDLGRWILVTLVSFVCLYLVYIWFLKL